MEWGDGMGIYDPSICLANDGWFRSDDNDSYTADMNTDYFNGGSNYNWTTLGILAPIWAAQNPTAFARAKETVSKLVVVCKPGGPRHEFTRHCKAGINETRFLRVSMLVYTGYGLQPPDGNNMDASEVAWIGGVYRQNPKIYSIKDHPPRHS
jgi:hypothetical protein